MHSPLAPCIGCGFSNSLQPKVSLRSCLSVECLLGVFWKATTLVVGFWQLARPFMPCDGSAEPQKGASPISAAPCLELMSHTAQRRMSCEVGRGKPTATLTSGHPFAGPISKCFVTAASCSPFVR